MEGETRYIISSWTVGMDDMPVAKYGQSVA